MEIILLFGISILPALFLLWYYDRYDSARPEPRRILWKAFKWGIIATFAAGVIEQNLFYLSPYLSDDLFVHAFLVSFIFVALIEEGLKFFIVRKIIWKTKHFDEVMDGIIYAICASLGFATLENLFYVFEGGFTIGVARALLAVPAHALFSGIMGFYIGKAKMLGLRSGGRGLLLRGLFIAVFYHGLYDFLLMTETMLAYLVVPLVVLMFFHLRHKIRVAHFEDGLSKEKPVPWGKKRIARFGFGIFLIATGIFYVIGMGMMIEMGQYTTHDIPAHVFVLLLVAGGIFWSLRHHALPKKEWKKEVKLDKDVKKVLKKQAR